MHATFKNATLDAFEPNLLGGWAMDSLTTIEVDRSENGRNGVIVGTPSQGEVGKDNNAILFNEDGVIDTGSVGPTLTGQFTFGFWFKSTDTSDILWVASIGGFLDGIGIALDLTPASNRIYVYGDEDIFFDPESRAFSNVVTLNDGNFHLITVSRKSDNNFGMHLDGLTLTPQFSDPFGVDLSDKTMRFCTRRDNNDLAPTTEMLIATLDESWLWDTELSVIANAALWNGGAGRFLTKFYNSEIDSARPLRTFLTQRIEF